MSEGGGSSGPELGPNYQNSGPASYSNPPSQPPTPSSTVQDPPNYHNQEINENSNESKPSITSLHSNSASGLPPFSSFAASDVTEGLGGRLASDGYLTSDGISSTRVMELSGWDYCYTDNLSGRYLDRDSMPVMIPQPQYRPWESKQDGSHDNIKSSLPSFQSQFGEELVTTLTTLTPAACSPAPSVPSPSLPSFHTLSTVNPRYPLVPAPVQAREIPSIQQQFLDERHIHLFPPGQNFSLQPQNGLNGQTLTTLNNGTTLTTLNNAQYHPQIINNAQILPSGQILAPQSHILTPSSQIITSNGHIITSSGGHQGIVVSQNSTPTVLTVVKTEPVNIVELKSSSTEPSNLSHLHHTNFQNPLITQGQQMDSKFGLESPPRGIDGRKKERRKIRASSLESSNESDGAMSVESSGQVAAVSSTAGFKSPMTPGQMNNEGDGMITDTGEKQTKKKRKRCGECIGCQRKDNCGDCAPCRNDKSHQICKMRRCEKLTEKKHLLAYNREDGGVSYRGRGRGRGRGSRGGYRGKAARPGNQSAQVTSVVTEMNSAPGLVVGSGRENVKIEGGRVSSGPIPSNPALAPTMAVPFYPGTEVWPTSAPENPWASQGQFIHQIDDIRYQHYPGYQTTGYQQTGFITDQTSAFQPQYTSGNNGTQSTSPVQGSVTPRSTGSYTQVHTPTPSPNPPTSHVNGHRNGISVHYIDENNYVNGTSFNTDSSMAPPASTTPNSRSSSVHLEANETNNKTSSYMSGNEIPGYPLNSPQCQSSCNSSGYPGQSLQSEFGDQSANGTSYQQTSNNTNHVTQKSPSYTQASPGTYQNYQNYNQISPDQHQKSPKPGMSPGSCHPSQKSSGIYPQNSPKNYNSNPSPQNYQQISPGQSRNAGHYENRTVGNGNVYQNERFDQQQQQQQQSQQQQQQQRHYNENYPIPSPSSQNYSQNSPNNMNQDKSNVNARIKTMIMNKHQMSQGQQQNRPNSNFSASNDNHMMSPNREMMSPSQQFQQQNSQMMSPIQNANQMMSPNHQNKMLMSPNHQNNQLISNNQITSPNSKDSKNYIDRIQQNDYGDKKQVQINDNSNHFLAFSHHLREGSVLQPEGGGGQNWMGNEPPPSNYPLDIKSEFYEPFEVETKNKKCKKKVEKSMGSMSAMENFMKFASADFDKMKPYASIETEKKLSQSEFEHRLNMYDKANEPGLKMMYGIPDPIRNLEANFPTKKNINQINLYETEVKTEGLGNLRDCRRRDKIFPPYENVTSTNYRLDCNKLYQKDGMNYRKNNFPEGFERDRLMYKSPNNNYYPGPISNFQGAKPPNYPNRMNEYPNSVPSYPNEKMEYPNYNSNYNYMEYGNFPNPNVKIEPVSKMDQPKVEYPRMSCSGPRNEFAVPKVEFPEPKVEYPKVEETIVKQEFSVAKEEIVQNNSSVVEEEPPSEYPRISYAPNVRNMEIIDRRYGKSKSPSREKWEEYQKVMEEERKGESIVKKEKESYLFEGDGGPMNLEKSTGAWCCRLGGIETPTPEHLRDGCCQGMQTADELPPDKEKSDQTNGNNSNGNDKTATSKPSNVPATSQPPSTVSDKSKSPGPGQENTSFKDYQENADRLKNNLRADVPDCQCFPPDKFPPEPGSYYTHLGTAASLPDLRKDLEARTGHTGKALRIEKICYTGKEGKTTQGCPLAKWVIRRSGADEKFLIVVKHRQGHTCSTAWIVVCLVAWEGVPSSEADKVYTLLSHKLNRYGLPTTRRCATNEPRTCACQGLDPDSCGASFSFGCSWSMYYNGCKYARSKTVRKFRLSVRSEEQEVEERMHVLATLLSPLYNTLAPDAFQNQTMFEREASECRLGFKPGRPFSGVTACIDFCAHSHRDLHNMNNGCTVVVTLTKHRSLSKPEDEQLHVLPLYIMDETDEFGSKEAQEAKFKNGAIECLNKFPCEVRVRAVPLQPCRRHGKKRKDEEIDAVIGVGKAKETNHKNSSPMRGNNSASPMQSLDMQSMLEGMEVQLQSSQVSSTVMDSPVGMYHQSWGYHNMPEGDIYGMENHWNRSWMAAEAQRKQNWINSSQMPPQWEYPGYVSDRDAVDPDSTTTQNQACSPSSNRSTTSISACSNPLPGNGSPLSSPPSNNQSLPSWQQNQPIPECQNQQTDETKQPEKKSDAAEDPKKEERNPNKNGKNSPLMSPQQWPEYPTTPSPVRQSPSSSMSPFRIPKGRPPSRQNPIANPTDQDQNETFLKPLPKDKSDNQSTSMQNSTKETDNAKPPTEIDPANIKEEWPNRFQAPEFNGNTVSAQNPFTSTASAFNPAQNYQYQKNNIPNQNFNNGNNNYQYGVQGYNGYMFENKQPSGNWPEYLENRYDERYPNYGYPHHQNFNNFPSIPSRWDSHRWDLYGPPPFFPVVPEAPKSEPIGEVTDYIENEECFKDPQMGGVAIALGHGSVLFECAKHELHATTALKRPNRLHPTRISLVFYQHRNLNRAKHGWDEWEEKMRLRKLGINTTPDKASSKDSNKTNSDEANAEVLKLAGLDKPLGLGERILVRVPTYTTTTWTTLFPMRPCMVTGPYQEGGSD